jgi:hypothetical protein
MFSIDRKYLPWIVGAIIVLAVPAIALATFTRVSTGEKTICKYDGMTIKDNTKKIIVLRWNADEYEVKIHKGACTKHKKLEAMYEDAVLALKKGDLAKAKQIFENIKRADPKFKDINTQIGRIDEASGTVAWPGSSGPSTAPGTPGSPGSPGSPGTPSSPETPGSPGTDTPVTPPPPDFDLASLLPDSIPDYKAGSISKNGADALRPYYPKYTAKILALLVSVHLVASQSEAENFINRVNRVVFSKDAQNVTTNGYAAYFGTDGTTYATLAWAKGRVVYELQMHSATGTPAGLFSDAMTVSTYLN